MQTSRRNSKTRMLRLEETGRESPAEVAKIMLLLLGSNGIFLSSRWTSPANFCLNAISLLPSLRFCRRDFRYLLFCGGGRGGEGGGRRRTRRRRRKRRRRRRRRKGLKNQRAERKRRGDEEEEAERRDKSCVVSGMHVGGCMGLDGMRGGEKAKCLHHVSIYVRIPS